MTTEGLVKAEFRIKRADNNSIRTLKIQTRLIIDEKKDSRQLIGLIEDITQEKLEAAEKLAALEWKKIILSATDYSLISTDENGIIQTFNPAAERMLGYNAAEVIGIANPGIFHDVNEVVARAKALSIELNRNIKPGFEVFTLKAEELEKADENEWTYVRKDGSRFPISLSVTVLKDTAGKVAGYLGIAIDLTERKKSESQILVAHERLERVIDATGEGILEVEFAGERLPFLDSQAKQIFELKSNERPTFDKILSQIHAHDRHRVTSEIERHYRERTQRFEIEFRVADLDDQSKIKWARAKGKIVETSEKAALLVGTVSDITTRVEERLRLEDALKRAEAGTQAKSAFLATMSHEIRTPLNGVIGMTDLILETNLDLHQKKYAEIIQQSGSNLLALINDILDFSKIEANKLEYESEEFSLSQVIESQIDVLALRARNQNISLQSFISPHLPKIIIGDGGKLGQILVNLMGNAVKFTRFGGVAVRVITSKTKIANLDSTWVRFEVEDTGIGLSKEGIEKLFKPFSQVSQGSKRKYGGTGLGLSISKRLVEGMGGQIGVESKESTGSTFWFEIEFKLSLKKQTVNEINFTDDLKKSRVLVLEEDQISKDILFLYAESFGMSAASSSLSGGLLDIKTAQQRKRNFNLVFIAPGDNLDDAILIARSAKELFGPAAPKFALLLHFGQAAPSEELGKDLFDEVIFKPFKQSHLIEVFERIKSPESIRKVEALQNFISSAPISEDQVSFNILVADDLAVNQMLAQKILESLGHRSKVAINGLEVLELIKAEKFDLVLMDCQMPELDGFGATAAIREIEKSSGEHIMIVALTANAMDGDHKRCTDAGMDDYLSKPIKKDKLNAMIEKWLNPSADNKIAG